MFIHVTHIAFPSFYDVLRNDEEISLPGFNWDVLRL